MKTSLVTIKKNTLWLIILKHDFLFLCYICCTDCFGRQWLFLHYSYTVPALFSIHNSINLQTVFSRVVDHRSEFYLSKCFSFFGCKIRERHPLRITFWHLIQRFFLDIKCRFWRVCIYSYSTLLSVGNN